MAETATAEPGTDVSAPQETDGTREGRWRRVLPAASMVGVLLLALLMPLRNVRNFYYWDDTAGAAVGVWQRVAEQALAGNLPFLQLDMWRGGNFAAEAATGMWNPVMLALMVITHALDNVAVAITLAKFALFVILSLGVYLLAREHGATRWVSAAAGLALSVSGYTLFMDGTSWINGLAIFAFTPWMWWAVRRNLAGRGSILLSVLTGYLLVSSGNPYGLVAFAAVLSALAVEQILQRRYRSLWSICAQIAIGVLSAVVVYLPFLLTSTVGVRADSVTFNDEFMAPGLSDLLGLSTPGFQPFVTMFGAPYMTFPAAYLAWFVLPLLPWLKWREVMAGWRDWSAISAFGIFYLLFVLGPSQIWMFRWPARLIPFLYLAVIVLFAMLLSRGIARDRRAMRWTLTASVIVAGAWQGYADRPQHSTWMLAGVLGVAALTVIFLRVGSIGGRGFAVIAVGSLGVLGVQTHWMPSNESVANYDFPESRSEMESNFAGRYEGLTIQVGSYYAIPPGEANADGAWQDMLLGNTYSVSGVESTTAYTGIGFNKHDGALCLNYQGATCAEAWPALWEPPLGESEPLADFLRAETVVAQKGFVNSAVAPAGWELVDETEFVRVFRRMEPLDFPDGRLSVVDGDVTVTEDVYLGDRNESATVSSGEGGRLTFARLAWPGYSATIDGAQIETRVGSAGLLEVEIPPALSDAELKIHFSPPGLSAGLAALALAALGTAALFVYERIGRRRNLSKETLDA